MTFEVWLETVIKEFNLFPKSIKCFWGIRGTRPEDQNRWRRLYTGNIRSAVLQYAELPEGIIGLKTNVGFDAFYGIYTNYTGYAYIFSRSNTNRSITPHHGDEKETPTTWICKDCKCYNDMLITGWCTGKQDKIIRKIYVA